MVPVTNMRVPLSFALCQILIYGLLNCATQLQALENIHANEGVYFLEDSESVWHIVFAGYMSRCVCVGAHTKKTSREPHFFQFYPGPSWVHLPMQC